jgi:predicted ATPase with chaperone activity
MLKLARTVADLARSEFVGSAHVAESIQYRERVE